MYTVYVYCLKIVLNISLKIFFSIIVIMKMADNARSGERDKHPFSPKTSAPQYQKVKVKSSMVRSLSVENLLPQNVGSIINYLQ